MILGAERNNTSFIFRANLKIRSKADRTDEGGEENKGKWIHRGRKRGVLCLCSQMPIIVGVIPEINTSR